MIVVILDSVLLTKRRDFFHAYFYFGFFGFYFYLNSSKILGIIFHILVINIILYFYVEIYNFMTLIAKVYFMLNYFWS